MSVTTGWRDKERLIFVHANVIRAKNQFARALEKHLGELSSIGGPNRVFEIATEPGAFGFVYIYISGDTGEGIGLSFDQSANAKSVHYWSLALASEESEYSFDLPAGFDIEREDRIRAVVDMIRNRTMGRVEI